MRKSHSIVLALLLTLVAVMAAAQDAPAQGVVNINTAGAEQFALLPGIGPKTGERIVAWRDENGPFKKATDLMQVKGIGDRTFERISPYLTLEGKTTLTVAVRLPRKQADRKPATQAQP
jgi:competence protein ComEA